MEVPRRRPTATCTSSSLSRKPQLEIGKACSQSLLCSAETAKSRALSCEEEIRRLSSDSTTRQSQLLCLWDAGPDGAGADDVSDDQVLSADCSWLVIQRPGDDRIRPCMSRVA